MSKRAKKERRERRNQGQNAAPATSASKRVVEKGPARAPTAPARASTFEVAAAHRRLADELPNVVHQRSKAPAMRKLSLGPAGDPSPARGQIAAKAAPSRREKPSLKIDKPPQTACKAKPSRTGGDGNSRDYVPWCR